MSRIVVIDDEDGVRDMLRRVLEQAGHQVFDAPDGKRGLELVRVHAPDLVITDILMPEQEGLETIRIIRRTAIDTPIVAISGGGRTARMDFLEVALEFGANATLAKPFRPRELVGVVDKLLAHQSQQHS